MLFGQKRSGLRDGATALNAALHLRYTGQSEMCVQGSVTGSVYQFHPRSRCSPLTRETRGFCWEAVYSGSRNELGIAPNAAAAPRNRTATVRFAVHQGPGISFACSTGGAILVSSSICGAGFAISIVRCRLRCETLRG